MPCLTIESKSALAPLQTNNIGGVNRNRRCELELDICVRERERDTREPAKHALGLSKCLSAGGGRPPEGLLQIDRAVAAARRALGRRDARRAK